MDRSVEIGLIIVAVILVHGSILYWVTRSKKKSIKGRHVVVTGGSSGIGKFISVLAAQQGAHVTIIARNVELLMATKTLCEENRVDAGQIFAYKSIDLSRDFRAIENCFEQIAETSGPVYMLVNCAGQAICGTFEDTSVDVARQLMDINYFTAFHATKCVLPNMKAAKEGIVVLTASLAGLFGVYGYSAYSATKFALRGLAETVQMEVKHCNVSVTLACPADTDTPGFANEEKTKPEETKIISGSGGLMKPEDVAKKIMNDALKGSFFSVLGIESFILSILCVGMAPWTSNPLLCLLQVYAMGPLRLVSFFIQWNFQRIIKSCAKQKKE